MKDILVIGHRGAGGTQRENTLDAFLYAIEQGCKALEMDLRFDYVRKRFYLEHDFFHHPKIYKNTFVKMIPELPKHILLVIEFKSTEYFTDFFARSFKRDYDEFLKNRNVVAISYNPFILMQLRKLDPKIQRGYLCGNPISFMLFKTFFRKRIKPSYLFIHKRMLKKRIIDFTKAHRLKSIAFVLNSEKQWKKAIKLGIKGIITDHPKFLTKFIKKI